MLRECKSVRSPSEWANRAQTVSKLNGENDLLSLASLVQSGNGGEAEAAGSVRRLDEPRPIAELQDSSVAGADIIPVFAALPTSAQQDEEGSERKQDGPADEHGNGSAADFGQEFPPISVFLPSLQPGPPARSTSTNTLELKHLR